MKVEFDYKEVIVGIINQYLASLEGIHFEGPFSKNAEELIEKNTTLIEKKKKLASSILDTVQKSTDEQEALSQIKLALQNKSMMKPKVGDFDLLHCLNRCKKILETSKENNSQKTHSSR